MFSILVCALDVVVWMHLDKAARFGVDGDCWTTGKVQCRGTLRPWDSRSRRFGTALETPKSLSR